MKVLGERKRNRDVEPQRKEEELGMVVTIMNLVSFWRAHEMFHVAEWKTGYLI